MRLSRTALLWCFLFLGFAFVVYSSSFEGVPIIREKHSVLGDADSANFFLLIEDFHLSKKYGDEYKIDGRSLGDNAQKHKIHHLLYAIAGSAIYKVFRVIYAVVGIDPSYAVYSVNAFLAVCNIAMLCLLLRYFGLDDPGRIVLFLAFYAFSLSTWIYASVPESWTFSATLILLFLTLHYRFSVNPLLLSLLLGVAMLNNLFLGSLIIFLAIHFLNTSNSPSRFLIDTARSGLIMIVTWTASLYLLSFFDSALRPDRFIEYTFWFRDFVGYERRWYDPYVWKILIAGLFFNPIASNQADPFMPPEALLSTLKESPLGAITLLLYLLLSVIVIFRIARLIGSKLSSTEGPMCLLKEKEIQLACYCLTWVILTWVMYPPSGFLYSTMILPLMALLIHGFTDMERFFHRALLYATVAAIVLNNSVQIMSFREILLSR